MARLKLAIASAPPQAAERLRGLRPPWARVSLGGGQQLLAVSLASADGEDGAEIAQLAAASFASEPRDPGWVAYLGASDLRWALAGIALLAGGFHQLEVSDEGRKEVEGAQEFLETLPAGEEASVEAYAESGWLYLSCPFEANARAKSLGWYRWDPDRREWRYPDTPVQRALLNYAFRTLNLAPAEAANRLPQTTRAHPAGAPPRGEPGVLGLRELGEVFAQALAPVVEELRRLRSEVETLRAVVESSSDFATVAELGERAGERLGEASADDAPAGGWEELLRDLADDPAEVARRAKALLEVSPSNEVRAVVALAEERCNHWQESLRALVRVQSASLPRQLAAEVEALRKRVVERALRHLVGLENGDGDAFDALLEELRAGDVRSMVRLDQAGELLTAAVQVAAGVPQLEERVRALSFIARLLAGEGGALPEALAAVPDFGAKVESACMLGAAAVSVTGVRSLAGLHDWWPDEEGPREEDELTGLLERAAEPFRGGQARQAGWFPTMALAWLSLAAPYESSPALVRLRRYFRDSLRDESAAVGQYLAGWAGALRAEHKLNPQHYRGLLDAIERQALAEPARWLTVRRYLSIMARESSQAWQRAVAGGEESLLLRILQRVGLRDAADFQVAFDLLYAGDQNARGLLQLADWVLGREIQGADQLAEGDVRLLLEACLERASQSHEAVQAFHRLYQHLLEYEEDSALDVWLQEQAGRGPGEKRFRAQVAYVERVLARGPGPEDARSAIQGLAQYVGSPAAAPQSPHLLEVLGLVQAFPGYRPQFEEIASVRAALDRLAAQGERSLRPLRLFIAGGHQQMRRHGKARLEEEGHRVTWLTAEEVARGDQALALAQGSCDLVVIITAYISHPAAERVRRAAEAAGTEVLPLHATGVGSLLLAVEDRAAGATA